nr:hypothetical protein [uncultured Draconibacterium sp.]
MIRIATIIFFLLVTTQIYSHETKYQKNLKLASDLFIAKSELPDTVLLKLVPDNYDELELLYETTSPDSNLENTGFFSNVIQQIFDKYIIEKKEKFYLPCLQLASFADGEFGEEFIDNLKVIIKLDKNKFCESIKGKEYADRNPIKYYSEQNDCK